MSMLFHMLYVNICCLVIYSFFSEFNIENKMDQRAKSSSGEKGDEGNEEDPEFLEELDESAEDKDEGDEFEVGDEYDENQVSRQIQEPTDLKQKTVSRATAVWEHYKPRLLTNGARVAYLCSPNPTIIAHSEANKDALITLLSKNSSKE